MRVSEMMTPEPVVVDGGTPLAECAARMVRLRIRHLPVMVGGLLRGVVTDSAVFQRGSFLGEPDTTTPTSAFVTYDTLDEGLCADDLAVLAQVLCRPDDALEPVVRALAASDQDYAMVLDAQGGPVGIITEHDTTRLAVAVLPQELTVDHLGERRLFTALASRPAGEVLEELARRGIRHVLVVDLQSEVVGVVSQRDLVMDDVLRRPHVLLDEVVRSKVVYRVAPGTTLVACAEKMLAEGIGCLPVLRNGTAVGIVTRRDLVEALGTALETEGLFGGG